MKSKVTVVNSERRETTYAGKTGGVRTVVNYTCKCILHDAETDSVDVGTLRVPESLVPDGVAPGDYWVDFKLGRGFGDDTVKGLLCLFEPVAAVAARPVGKGGNVEKVAAVA
jgi:hypothetical protein